ncbi:MAG: hypothetical protein V4577_28260 [Bacteroidota bacterium]
MEEEVFTRSIWTKFFYSALATGGAIFCTVTFLNDAKHELQLALFLILLWIFAILVIVSQIKNKVIISAERIAKISLWGNKELLTANVKGVRIEQKYIVIEPVSPQYDRIVINNYQDYSDNADLTAWLAENFTDQDSSDLKEQNEDLLSDASLGANEQERQAKLAAAKTIALVYNICGVAAGIWGLFSDTQIALIVSLSFPLLGIAVMAVNKLIKFMSNPKRSAYPYIIYGFMLNIMFIAGKSGARFNIYIYHNAFIPALAFALIMVTLLIVTGINPNLPKVSQYVIMTIFCSMYAFGSVLQINCAFDHSSPAQIQTVVYDKYTTYSKGKHYNLKLAITAERAADSLNTEVSAERYYKYNPGDTMQIYMRKGLLNIPWYSFHNNSN